MVNKILFLVGKQTDYYPIKYTSRKAPKWLKHGAKEFEQFNMMKKTGSSDVAMASYLSYHHPNSEIDCILEDKATSKIIKPI